MSEADRLREAVERAVLAALDEHLPALRDAVIAAVLQELDDFPAAATSSSAALNTALAALMERGSQADILSCMLDSAARFSGRAALFVLRGGVAQGWQARGLPHDEGIKAYSIDLTAGLARRAIDARAPAVGSMSDFDARFAVGLGAPAGSDSIVLPLIVRNKVAALLYADSGQQPGGAVDTAALEILVRGAGSWIELAAFKKAQGGVAVERPAAARAVAASAGPVPVPPAPVELSSPEVVAPLPPAPPVAVATPPPSPRAVREDDETHRKAKRFAKLLVEEIKLYNEAKVGQGRQNRNLYDLLRDDIEKSRASYEKRYGESMVGSTDYFTQELIRILADGNESLLGSNIPR